MRLYKVAGIVIASAMALSACTGGSSGSGSSKSNQPGKASNSGTLTLGNPRSPTGEDIVGIVVAGSPIYQEALYDTVVREEPDGSIGPDLATKWSYSADLKTLTMTLRTGVKFTDGTPADAAAAKASLDILQKSSSIAANALAGVTTVTAPSATSLKIQLSQPDPGFLLALTSLPIGSPTGQNKSNAKTTPYGSGPYLLDTSNTIPGTKYVYNVNPNYWDKSIQHYKKLIINVYGTSQSLLSAIRGKLVQGVDIDDFTIVPQIKSAGFNLLSESTQVTGLLFLDRAGQKTPALGNLKVRQAINYAVDRTEMLRVAVSGYGTPTSQIFGPSTDAYVAALNSRYAYSPTMAKQLLAEAGYSHLTLSIPQYSGVSAAIWPLLKQYLNAVGITVNYTVIPSNQTQVVFVTPQYGLLPAPLDGGNLAQDLNNFYLSTAPVNPFKVKDSTIDNLATKIRTSPAGSAAAKAAGAQLGTYMSDQAIAAPWYIQNAFFALSKDTTAQLPPNLNYPVLWSFQPKS